MRILLVHERYQQRGGEDEVFEAEAGLLASHGHEVVRFTKDNREIAGYSWPEKAALAVRTAWARDAQRELGRLIAREEPDVAHFHNTFPLISPAAYYACNRLGVPVVQTVHNYRLVCPAATLLRDQRPCEACVGRAPWPAVAHGCYHGSTLQSAIVAGALSVHRGLGTYRTRVQRYLALTEFGRDVLVRGGLPAERVRVKPNFLARDPGLRSGPGEYALFVGRLAPEKGVRTLLEAWKQLPHLPLRIVGDGPLRAEVEARARALPNVTVVGSVPRDEVFAHLRAASMLVFPSEWYEGFGLVIVEAFAAGVPVIASALGAPRELLEQGRLGRLFRPGAPEALVEAARQTLSEPLETMQRVQRARAVYERRFSAQAGYDGLLVAYAEARAQFESDSAA